MSTPPARSETGQLAAVEPSAVAQRTVCVGHRLLVWLIDQAHQHGDVEVDGGHDYAAVWATVDQRGAAHRRCRLATMPRSCADAISLVLRGSGAARLGLHVARLVRSGTEGHLVQVTSARPIHGGQWRIVMRSSRARADWRQGC